MLYSVFSNTVAGLMKDSVSRYGDRLLLQKKDGWSWKQITWKDFQSEVKSIAAFLTDGGFRAGDRAFFESGGTHEGLVAETAVLMLGGVASSCPPSEGRPPKVAFALSRESARKLSEHGAEKTVLFSQSCGEPVFRDCANGRGLLTDFRAVLKFGFMKSKKLTDFLDEIFGSTDPQAVAVEFPSSDGATKSLSQSGFMEAVSEAVRSNAACLNEESQTFHFLPGADIFSRAAKFLALCVPARAAAADSGKDFLDDILEIMPTVVLLDSRRLEEAASSLSGANAKSELGGRVIRILTDRLPNGGAAEFYARAGIELTEVFPQS